MRVKVSLLISGKLGFELLKFLDDYTEIVFIATDKNSLEIINYAKSKFIPHFVGNPRKGKLASFINNFKSELLLSINYLFILEKDVIDKFLFPINFHGSLLPKYRGRTPHVWAIINNEVETGVTAHFIDQGCDTGDIILQKIIPVSELDTGYTMLNKYMQVYPKMINEVIEMYISGNLKGVKQNDLISTYYGKRTPNDGHINWDWQRERIRNWVRAQSFPYPGAFTFFENDKIIIDEVSFSELGFNNDAPNGLILQVEPDLVIKTPNGALKIDSIRNKGIMFIQNKILI